MVFDAHDRAFAFLGGACQRGIYDNMKTSYTSTEATAVIAPPARGWHP